MKQRLLYYIVLFGCLIAQLTAQNRFEHINTRRVNFGANAGFNSGMFLVDEFQVNDITIDETASNYKVGYFATLFMRVNIKNHFIQPEFSYSVANHEIQFDKRGSQHPDLDPDYAYITSRYQTLDFSSLYGYNFIKSGIYGMAFFAGPKVKFTLSKENQLSFENFDQQKILEKLYPLNISGVIGLGVNISSVFFDFRYEIGVSNISKSITYESIENGDMLPIVFKRRNNVLSFSLGLMF
ncbi:MAG: PorT family protein [Bacteroides sp.]|nr:PorT family protein [Bacteroides sp.]